MSAIHVVSWSASCRRFMPGSLLRGGACALGGACLVTRRLAGRAGPWSRAVVAELACGRLRAAVVALAGVALLAGCASFGGNFSARSFAPGTAVVSLPAGQPGAGKPAVTLGTKNFTEEFIVGQLYAQALAAKGFTVHLRQDIGPTEVIDPGLLDGTIDLYPEYTGEIITTLTNIALGAPGGAADRAAPPPPQSWQQAYEQAARFEDRRGFTLLQPTPFQDTDKVIVLKAFAAAHHLSTLAQLAGLGPLRLGSYAPEQTRYEGYVGLQQAYGLGNLQFVPLAAGGPIFAALDSGQVQVADVFSTDPQLRSGKYTVLSDPKNIFGYQNLAPVVRKAVLTREGPAFAQTLNAVSSHLTTAAIQRLNAEVVLGHRSPADAARQFLASEMSG
jgi:osmoprotectant transport system substrate-binding protein